MITFTIGTQNILNPYHAVKHAEPAGVTEAFHHATAEQLAAALKQPRGKLWQQYSNWDLRRTVLARNIGYTDITCLQEVSAKTARELDALTKHQQLAEVAFHDEANADISHGNAVFFNPGRLRLEDRFVIRHDHGDKMRIAAGNVFSIEDLKIGVLSVHLSGYNTSEQDPDALHASKKEGFDELLTFIDAMEKRAHHFDIAIIAGDYNQDFRDNDPERNRLLTLEKFGYMFDSNRASTEPRKGRRIDWVAIKSVSGKPLQLTPMELEDIQFPASDHLMTGTMIGWNG